MSLLLQLTSGERRKAYGRFRMLCSGIRWRTQSGRFVKGNTIATIELSFGLLLGQQTTWTQIGIAVKDKASFKILFRIGASCLNMAVEMMYLLFHLEYHGELTNAVS